MAPATSWAAVTFTSKTAMSAPSAASASAMPRPMPWPAPVTIAVCPSRFMRSSAAELRLALLLERAEALRSVLGGEELRREPDLERESSFERHRESDIHGLLGEPETERRPTRPEPRHLEGRVHFAPGWSHTIHEADAERFGRVDRLGREQDLLGASGADQAGAALGAAGAGHRSNSRARDAEARVLRGDAHVAGEGQLEAAGQTPAGDSGDDRLRAALDRCVCVARNAEGTLRVADSADSSEVVEIHPGGEASVIAPHDEDADARVLA